MRVTRHLFRPRPMRATADERTGRRPASALALSVALHAALLLPPWPTPQAAPAEEEEEVLEVAFIQGGDPSRPPGPPPGTVTPSPELAARSPRRRPTPPASLARAAPPPSPDGDQPLPSPAPAPTAPTSFREWERSHRSAFLPRGVANGTGGGDARGGPDGLTSRGRDRCEPRPGRRFDVLYLLFDSSGSMSSTGRAQALACAHQYTRAALDTGASIVVGNFARGTRFTGPTTSLFDVEAALRDSVDGSATIVPARELQPFLDAAPDAVSELVIVSDGRFMNTPEILIWYEYFLALDDENRGTMYTVGSPGHRPSVAELRRIGFDVFVYEQLRRPEPAPTSSAAPTGGQRPASN